VAYGVNAVQEKADRYGGAGISSHQLSGRIAQADRLARAVSLDMVEAGWRPTVETYLGRVTKPRILEAVREGAGADKAELIAHLKKPEMAKEAERLLADTGWLPEALRTPTESNGLDVGSNGSVEDAAAATGTDLPAFLAGDDDDEIAAEDDGADLGEGQRDPGGELQEPGTPSPAMAAE
jgi:ParB family chromosome partitioning protein